MEKSEIKKFIYESPVLLDLGEFAKAVGLCSGNGSSNNESDCTDGTNNSVSPCTAYGNLNSASTCTNGFNAATSSCNVGISAPASCGNGIGFTG